MFEYNLENEMRIFLLENKPVLRKYFGVSYYEFQLNKYFMSHLIKSMVRKCSFLSRSTVETMSEDKYKVIHKLFSFIKIKDIPDEIKRLFQERETQLFIKEAKTRIKIDYRIGLENNVSLQIKTIRNDIGEKMKDIQNSFIYNNIESINNKIKYKEIIEILNNYFITIIFFIEFKMLYDKRNIIFPISFFRETLNIEKEKYKQNEENIVKCKILANRLPMDVCKYVIYPYLK